MGDDQQPPAIHAVGDNAARYGKNHHRKSSKEAGETQLKGRVGDLVDLPGNRYSGDLAPNRREEQARPKKAEVSLLQNLPGRNLSLHSSGMGVNPFESPNYGRASPT